MAFNPGRLVHMEVFDFLTASTRTGASVLTEANVQLSLRFPARVALAAVYQQLIKNRLRKNAD